jgi:hypothetical protein
MMMLARMSSKAKIWIFTKDLIGPSKPNNIGCCCCCCWRGGQQFGGQL